MPPEENTPQSDIEESRAPEGRPAENTPQEKSALERMSEKLYSAKGVGQEIAKGPQYIKQAIPKVREGWEQGREKVLAHTENSESMKKQRTFLKTFILSGIAFFVVSLAIAAYVFLGGVNQVSPENIVVSIVDSVNVPAGKQYDFTLSIKNTNNVELRDTKLTVFYPDGTRNPDSPTLDLKREVREVGSIKSDSLVKQDFSAILYGEKGSSRNIVAALEYKVPGSDSSFIKESVLEVVIDASLVSIDISMGNEFISGQTVTTDVFISSNTDTVVDDVMLIAEYPFGFSFESAQPNPSADESVWYIGSVSPTEKKRVSITGKVEGTANDERTIRFKLGVRSSNSSNSISSVITESLHTYSIQSPLLDLAVELNGKESGDTIINIGSTVSGLARVVNNLDVNVENASLELYVPAGIVDESGIKVSDGGFYRSTDRKIVWDFNNNSKLRNLKPGESVTLGFSVGTISASTAAAVSLRNPNFTLEGVARGLTENNRGSMGEVSTSATRLVKVNSKLSMTSNIFYSTGAFSNTGPVPPQANNRTTYTVVWSLTNNYNALTNTVVSATLPSYVEWVGLTSPSGEKISFNGITRKVTWDVGRLAEGVGQSNSPREVSFQVALVPSTSQIGSAPIVVQSPAAGARDDYTDQSISLTQSNLTTNIVNDPLYTRGLELVSP